VLAHKVSPQGARDVYGVVLDDDGHADETETSTARTALRRSRAGVDQEEVTA
jgi:N-methylhydantoinase B